MKFSAYQHTEQAGRPDNEDRVGYLYTPESALFVVADGMGGHAHGEIAAQIALDTMAKAFQEQALPIVGNPKDFLSKALLQAHHQILRFSTESGMPDSPRTTLVALLIQAGEAMWIHCGDSRLYWIRDEKLEQRTVDHSYAEQVPKDFNGTADSLSKAANRNVLFTCLGSPTKPIYDISKATSLKRGDKFLLCSDGLWGSLKEPDIVETLASVNVSLGVPRLIELALLYGGVYGDNVTGIGVEWQS